MIPKILHYCLVGRKQTTDLENRCMATWKAFLEGYHIHYWNEVNGPQGSRFFREACERKPINAVNYLRYWALHRLGGVYMDNDVEMLRPFDLSPGAFFGFQRDDIDQDSVNIAVIGASAGHPLFRRILDRLDADTWDACPIWTGPGIVTDELRKAGMIGLNVEQMVDDVQVYTKDRFYPWRWDESPAPERVTERTIAIHHWGKTWTP